MTALTHRLPAAASPGLAVGLGALLAPVTGILETVTRIHEIRADIERIRAQRRIISQHIESERRIAVAQLEHHRAALSLHFDNIAAIMAREELDAESVRATLETFRSRLALTDLPWEERSRLYDLCVQLHSLQNTRREQTHRAIQGALTTLPPVPTISLTSLPFPSLR